MGSFFEWMVESSLLVMMIMGIRKIFIGKIRYSIIYALWFVVLLRFMIPVNLVSTPISVGNLIPGMSSVQNAYDDMDAGFPEKNWQYNMQPGHDSNSASLGRMSENEALSKGDGASIANNSSRGQAEILQKDMVRADEADGINVRIVVKYGRLVVAALLLAWFVWSNLLLDLRLRRSRTLYGRRGRVRIYAASAVQNPCLYGFLRPSIYIPKALVSPESGVSADEEELAQIVTHEYVHYRHGDHIWAIFRILLLCYYWFDPFLWLAASCSKKDAELFCDETVIRRLGEQRRFSYGNMLVKLAQKASWCEFRYPIMSISKRGKEMEQRIRAISKRKCYSRWVVIPLAVIVLVAAGITCSSGIDTLAGGEAEIDSVSQKRFTAQKGQIFLENSLVDSYTGGVGRPQSADQETGELLPIHKRAIEKAFKQYVSVFTEAVNTGNVDKLGQVLAEGSDVYEQQRSIAKNYYSRGIREEVMACSVSSANPVSASQVVLCSDEKIRVFYADASVKIICQKYRYTCEYINQNWVITNMEEID